MKRRGRSWLPGVSGTLLALTLLVVDLPTSHGQAPAAPEPAPAGALKRFGTTQLRHGSRILSLAFSPNGKKLAAGGGNDPIRIWDTDTGTQVIALKDTWVQALAFAPPRGATLVSAGAFKKIRAWEVVSGKEDKVLEGHTTPIRALVVSLTSDGGLIVSGGQDGKIVLWEYPTYKKLNILEDHKVEITALALTPDSTRLASAGSDGIIRLWDTDSFKPLRQVEAGCYPTCLAFSSDGKMLLAGGDNNLIQLWEVATGKPLPPLKGHQGSLAALVLSRDGKLLASSAHDATIRLWDIDGRKETRKLTVSPGDVDALALSNDGKLVAAGGFNNTVHLFETETGKELFGALGPASPLTGAALTADNKVLAAGGPGRPLHLFDPATGKEIRQLASSHQGDLVVAVAPDNKTLATAGGAGPVVFWSLPAGDKKGELANVARDPILSLCYAPDGKQVATGHRTGMVRVWNLGDNKLAQELKYPGAAYTLAFAPDGKTIAVSGNSKVLVWDVASGKELRHIVSKDGPAPTQPHVSSLAFSPDGNTLALGCYDATTRLIDVQTGKEKRVCEGHKSAVLTLAFSRDGRTLATGSFDQTARLWESFSGQPIATFSGHLGPVNVVFFGANDRVLYSAGADTSLLAWDVTRMSRDGSLPMVNVSPGELQTAWNDLATEDTSRGHAVLWRLVAAANESVPFLGGQLYLVDPRNIDQLFVDLNSDKYEIRNKATMELGRYGMWMKGRLEEARKDPPSEEVRRRVEQLINKLNTPGALALAQERLRVHRIMLLLEQVGTPSAQEVLQKLARGAPEPFLQQEALHSLDRLKKRM